MASSWEYLETPSTEGIDAVFAAHRKLGADRGVLALVSEKDAALVAQLQATAKRDGVELLGAIVPGLVVNREFKRSGVLLATFDASAPHKLLEVREQVGPTPDEAVGELAEFIEASASAEGNDTLFLLVDATIPDVASLLDRLYLDVGDEVNYAGTCVGSETFKRVPCLFDAERFVQGAVLALMLRDHPGVTLAHHYRGGDALKVATATKGSQVEKIDGRPAFDVYRDLMASEYGIDLDKDSFYRYAVHFPFALNRAQGESLVRIPVAVGDDGSVVCSGEISENALLSVVRAVEPEDLQTAHDVAAGARGPNVESVLAFYCAGRFMHLEQAAASSELAALSEDLSPLPLFGALCLGEIGSSHHQYPAFHNATITAMPWT
ncbi:MAG: FIST C-terminal domain-containing protein [Polyangiaceae bacterium]